jgi:uncharacterized protein (DUF427 family)
LTAGQGEAEDRTNPVEHDERRAMMKAIWHDQVIAESDRTLEVGGYRYFPRDAVRMDLLHAVPKTESDLECPHGVQFYDVAENGVRSERAAWSYLAPHASMKQVDHWVGFWEDVRVE